MNKYEICSAIAISLYILNLIFSFFPEKGIINTLILGIIVLSTLFDVIKDAVKYGTKEALKEVFHNHLSI